jgi:hypothetical protein
MKLQSLRRFLNPLARILVAIVLLVGVGLMTPRKASAIFGIGDIVFDPSSWAELVSSDATLLEQLNQAYLMVENGIQTYNLAMAMSHSFSSMTKGSWLTLAQIAVADHVQDLALKGENGPWSSAMNGDPSQVPAAWTAATVGLRDLHSLMGPEAVGNSRLLGTLATINAMDGSGIKCMQSISEYRGNAALNSLGPVIKLAVAHLDGTAGTNSQIEQLNLANGHLNQQGTEMRAQGDMDTCLVEQMVIASKVQRDQQAATLNFAADYQNDLLTNTSFPTNVSSTFSHVLP